MYNNNYEFRYGDSTSISNFIHESNLIKMIKKLDFKLNRLEINFFG